MEEESRDLTIVGKPTIYNEDAKFYRDVYVFGRLFYDFDQGGLETFGDIIVDGNATFNGIVTFTNDIDIQKELPQLQVGILTVTEEFYVGESPENNVLNIRSSDGNLGLGTLNPQFPLDVNGDVRLSAQLYDSLNNPGVIGAFLTKDVQGVKWVEFEPSFTEGIFVYNEGVLVGVSSFRGLNLITNSGGNFLELVEGKPNVLNPNIADIIIKDFWEKRPAGLVTSAYVGIGLTDPTEILTVQGNTEVRNRLIVVGTSTFFGRTITYDGIDVIGSGSTIATDLEVTGVTTVSNNFFVTGENDATFERDIFVENNAQIDQYLYVGSATTIAGSFRVSGVSTFQNQVLISAAASVRDSFTVSAGSTLTTLIVGAASTFEGVITGEQAVIFEDTLDVSGPVNFFDTLDVDGLTTINNDLVVIQNTSIDGTLTVVDVTELQSTLAVGPAGDVIRTTGIGSVGFGTADPKRDIHFSNKGVYFDQGPIYDANNSVGVGSENTTEEFRVNRAVLSQVGVGTTGEIIGGRFFDAASMIRLNLEYLAGEAVGFITNYAYKGSTPFALTTSNYSSCRDDIKDIFRAICRDLTKGGNSQSVGAGLSYYNGNTLIHITGTDVNGYSIQDASVAAIDKAAEIARYVVNNSLYPISYQVEPINGTYADASRLIYLNEDFIAAEAVDRVIDTYPSFTIPNSNQSCIDDIKLILDAVVYNLSYGGNDRVYDATKYYIDNAGLLSGEEEQSIYAYEQARDIAIEVMRNQTVTKVSGILNSFTQYIDGTVLVDSGSPTCADQASAITSFIGIVTTGIGVTLLPSERTTGYTIPFPQIRDFNLLPDPERGSNSDPNGCANVVSAINVSAGIVTTIVGLGAAAAPEITYPSGRVYWTPRGADSKNIIYVSKYGNDENSGRTEGDAKLTIGAAAAVAQPGDTIYVRSGVYAENNPIGLRTDVSVSGQDLRLVTIYPQHDDDVFYVRRGCLIENLNFAYAPDPFDDNAPLSIKGAAVAFPPPAGVGSARSGALDPGPCNEGPSGRWRSPYIRNCTNFMTDSIGMKIDGYHVGSAFTGTNNPGQDLKCMVCDSFTQYNENGIGVSITNNGYAQLVSIFTINSKIAIYADTGGSCDLTNSNSSFGIYGLYADGVGAIDYTGITTAAIVGGDTDVISLVGIADTLGNIRRPYNGQAMYFQINLDDYADTSASGIVTAPLTFLSRIEILDGGSGYTEGSPPAITISSPGGPEGIIAEGSANVSSAGTVTSIDVTNAGRNYLPNEEVVISIAGGGGGIATAIMEPIYFTVAEATEPTSPAGITTVTLDQFVPYNVGVGVSVEMFRISRIVTSSHSFEYIGTGVNINRANPFQGGVPIPENEVVAINGAQVPFTSTDQAGNFRIGEGITIDQTTSTIRGRDFSRAIQAEVTPLILALR